AYVASHDLQEPLRMVGSYVQLLAKRYQGKLDADADDFIGFAAQGAMRMQRLIEDLLAFSRLGTRGATPVPTEAGTALDGALAGLKLAIDEAGATITHDPLPTVLADPGQLEHLFANLVGNALKFRGPEPPRVHIGAPFLFTLPGVGTALGAPPLRARLVAARSAAPRPAPWSSWASWSWSGGRSTSPCSRRWCRGWRR